MRSRRLTALTVLVFLGVHDQAAAGAWQFDCKYTRMSQSGNEPTESDFFILFNYDDITGKAKADGMKGVWDVMVHKGSEAISFMEMQDTGAVETTTVSLKTGASVHSRNTTRLVLGGCSLEARAVLRYVQNPVAVRFDPQQWRALVIAQIWLLSVDIWLFQRSLLVLLLL